MFSKSNTKSVRIYFYSEFVFMKKNWPDFTEEDLLIAIKEYQNRTIKKGK